MCNVFKANTSSINPITDIKALLIIDRIQKEPNKDKLRVVTARDPVVIEVGPTRDEVTNRNRNVAITISSQIALKNLRPIPNEPITPSGLVRGQSHKMFRVLLA